MLPTTSSLNGSGDARKYLAYPAHQSMESVMNHPQDDFFDVPPYMMVEDTDPSVIPDPDVTSEDLEDDEDELDMDEVLEEADLDGDEDDLEEEDDDEEEEEEPA